MKLNLVYIFCLIAISLTAKANATDTTKIIIIGTRHDGNAFIKPDSFLQIFRSFNPDIILCEADSNNIKDCRFIEGKGVEIALKYTNFKRSIETTSVLQYQKENPSVCIGYYDILIPHRMQYVKDLEKFKVAFAAALDTLYNSIFIKKKDRKIIAKYWQLYNTIIGSAIEKGLYFLNQSAVNNAFSNIQSLKRNELFGFFKKYPSLQYIEKRYKADIEFWEERNTVMATSILSVLQSNSSKKIIVLCGAAHKYFLLDKLLPLQTANGFVIKEFWE